MTLEEIRKLKASDGIVLDGKRGRVTRNDQIHMWVVWEDRVHTVLLHDEVAGRLRKQERGEHAEHDHDRR